MIEWEDFEIAIEVRNNKCKRTTHMAVLSHGKDRLEKVVFLTFQKFRALHNWANGGEEHNNAKETLKLIWDGLKKFADENQVCPLGCFLFSFPSISQPRPSPTNLQLRFVCAAPRTRRKERLSAAQTLKQILKLILAFCFDQSEIFLKVNDHRSAQKSDTGSEFCST